LLDRRRGSENYVPHGGQSATSLTKSSNRVFVAVGLFVVGALILLVRFPPADLAGWIAEALNVTLGVPFLGAAALFAGVAALVRTDSQRRVFMIVSIVAAGVSVVLGVLLIATPA
jgi:cytochrome c biogenesis protein CcdA